MVASLDLYETRENQRTNPNPPAATDDPDAPNVLSRWTREG